MPRNARSGGKPSSLACVGVACGALLLTVAATLLAVSHSPLSGGSVGLRRLQAGVSASLGGGPTGLQISVPSALPPSQLPLPIAVPGAFTTPAWTPTTTLWSTTPRRSSFDSSDGSSSASYGSSSESSKSSESNSLHSSGLLGEQTFGAFSSLGTSTFIQVVIMLCFTFFYNTNAVQPVLEARGTLKAMNLQDTDCDDFDNGICECCTDKWVCIHGLCCPLVRVAHTNAVAGICGFWETALCWCCCALISVNLGPCCLLVYWRMQLKQIMGISDHILNDVCITIFCPWFSICQQGTAVDTKLGYQVVGCFDLEWEMDKDMYSGDLES